MSQSEYKRDKEWEKVCVSLSSFNPSCNDEYGLQVIDYLVLDALAAYGENLKLSASQVQEYIKNNFKVRFEIAELKSTGQRLHKAGKIEYFQGERTQEPTLRIWDQTLKQLKSQSTSTRANENTVFQEWKAEIKDKYSPHLTEENLEQIETLVRKYLSKICARHGVACVGLLYPGDSKAQTWLNDLDKPNGYDELATGNDFLDTVFKAELPLFLRSDNESRTKYLLGVFNASFFWHIMQVDHNCSNLLVKSTHGQKLFLDNNILYSLVGFHGVLLMKSEHAMLDMAKKLGYVLCVTTKTLDEFQDSLLYKRKVLRRRPPIPRELAKIAAKQLGDEGILTNYWQALATSGVSIDEFINERSYLDDLINDLQIDISNKHRKDIETSPDLLEEIKTLDRVVHQERHELVVEHDAFHRILIRKLRKGDKFRYEDAVAWFLTHDTAMPAYGKEARRGKGYLPFCITTDLWVQVNRPLLSRVDNPVEFEESLLALITQPFVRSLLQAFSMEHVYADLMDRLSRYENMSPQFVLQLTSDRLFMTSLATEEDPDKKTELVENKFVNMSSKFENEVNDLRNELASLRGEKRNTEAQQRVLMEKIDALTEQIELISKEASVNKDNIEVQADKRKEAEEKLKQLKRNIKEKDSEVQGTNSMLNNVQFALDSLKSKVKWSIFGLLLIVTSLFIWVWLPDTLWITQKVFLTRIIANLLLISSLINIPCRQHWKTWLAASIALFCSLVALMAFS